MFSLDSDLRSNSSYWSVTIGPEGARWPQFDQAPGGHCGQIPDVAVGLVFLAHVPWLSVLSNLEPHHLASSADRMNSVAPTPKTNPLQLFNLARISHKYEFPSLEAWALNALTLAHTHPIHPSNNKMGKDRAFNNSLTCIALRTRYASSAFRIMLVFYNGAKVSTIL